MKFIMLVVCMSVLLVSAAIAEDTETTIVGPVMENRYVAPDPQNKETKSPETVQTLMEKGVIQVSEEARLEQKRQVQTTVKKKQF